MKRDLKEVIATNGADRSKAEAALAHVRCAIISNTAPALIPEQRVRANRLGNDNPKETLKDWVEAKASELNSSALKIEEAIEQLAAVAGQDAIAFFKNRRRAVATEPSKSRRQMLADTLMLDVGKALAAARTEDDQMRLLESQAASLSVIATPEARGLVRKIVAALAERKASSLAQSRPRQPPSLKKNENATQPPPGARPLY